MEQEFYEAMQEVIDKHGGYLKVIEALIPLLEEHLTGVDSILEDDATSAYYMLIKFGTWYEDLFDELMTLCRLLSPQVPHTMTDEAKQVAEETARDFIDSCGALVPEAVEFTNYNSDNGRKDN